jgi:hypothetical protein
VTQLLRLHPINLKEPWLLVVCIGVWFGRLWLFQHKRHITKAANCMGKTFI